jgi:hypothetical protein
MKRKERSPPSGPPQAAKGEDDRSSEEKRTMVALARILGAGPLVGGSLRLLEQLANCVQCPQEGVPRETAPTKPAAAQPAAPAEEESVETESTEVPMGELSCSGDPEHIGGHARCQSARENSIVSRTADASIRWSRKKDSS